MSVRAAINKHIAKLEAELAKEEAFIAASMQPEIVNGKATYFSMGDGYWKKRWALRNKLDVAYALLDEFAR